MTILSQLVHYLHHTHGQHELWAGFNETTAQRTGIVPIRDRVTNGDIWIDSTIRLALPEGVDSETNFYAFWFRTSEIGTIAQCVPDLSWASGKDLVYNDIDAYVCNDGGKVTPKEHTYYTRIYDYVVVVVRASAFIAVNTSLQDGAFSVYMEKTKTIKTVYTKHVISLTDRMVAYTKARAADIVFINGAPKTIAIDADIPLGVFVECITYSDTTSVSLFAGDSLESYSSTIAGEDVYLLHQNKSHNTSNYLIPAECCGLYAETTTDGIYVNAIDKDCLLQVTHNDVGVPVSIMASILLKLGAALSDITISVVFRRRASNKMLGADASYIKLLYSHDDHTILSFLLNDIPPADIAFWQAASLDTTQFVQDISGLLPDVTDTSMGEYVARYGFYETVNRLCPRVQSFSVGTTSQHTFNVRIPPMFNEQFVTAHVFLNGIKLDDNLVTVTPLMIMREPIGNTHVAFGHCGTVIIDQTVDFTPTTGTVSSLVVELFEDPNLDTMVIEAPDGTVAIPFDADYYEVYQAVDIVEPDANALVDATFLTKYVTVEPATIGTLADGELTFNASPNTYLVQSKVNMFRLGTQFNSIPETLSPTVVFGDSKRFDPIVINCIDNDGNPIVNVKSTMAYLNGRVLIYGVDYILRHQFEGTDWVMSQIIVQNSGYIEEENTLSVYATKDRIDFNAHGFAIPELPFGVIDGFGCYHNLSLYMANGYVRNTNDLPHWIPGNDVVATTHAPDVGRLCGFRTVLPILFYDYLNGLTSQAATDLSRLETLRDYLAKATIYDPDIIYIPESHRLYSLFTMYVVREALRGNIIIPADYSSADLSGLVADYLWLQDLDIVFDDNIELDYAFIDVYPAYMKELNDNPKLYQFCQDLMRTYIDTDAITHGDLVPLTTA